MIMQLKSLKSIVAVGALTALVLSGIQSAHADKIDIYLSGPDSTTSIYDQTTVETFESLAPGLYSTPYVSTIGTYQADGTSTFAISTDNQYGNGTGQYLGFGAQTGTSAPVTLTFSTPQSYFGFSWSAGDPFNGISFYRGSESLGYYSTQTILDKLSASTVTAYDGVTTYNSQDYFGKPGTGENSSEPYSFINIINTNGTFDRVVFDNSNRTNTGFEMDNHTIRTGITNPDGSFVPVGSAIPEAGTVTLIGLGLSAMGIIATRRRKS